ncbi:hypothetical protein TH61_02600 [Rufibacter sp. DG15C]|uniref:DUF6770 family protein n=1 Tax=Rufibacter sp. DG15C TaxID=1379909 RepID=UPI00078C68AB|nr:DUF6770 family protein [Rufibacter sp. DG15C]AMM50292.1 hypothetical protein TH61_02600 [Rufibacter sp. DG15C]
MKHLLRALTFSLSLLSATAGFSQSYSMEGFTNMPKNALTPIYDSHVVRGYTMYYKADKAARNLDNYGIDFFDQDLNKVKSVTLQKARNSHFLLENGFNGNTFGFYFYNLKENKVELETYDAGLNKIASKQIDNVSKLDRMMIGQDMASTTEESNHPMAGFNLYPVPNKGFIRNRYTGMVQQGFALEMYDNNLNLKWQYETDKKEKDNLSVMVNEVTEKYLVATIARKSGMMSQKMTFFIAAFDIETGKKLFEKLVEASATEQLSMSSVNYDKTKDEFLVVGEYYRLKDKPFVNTSMGFFVKRFSPQGEQKVAKFYAWDNEVRSLLPAAAKASLAENYVNYIHRVFRGGDGNLYLVAEQYKIAGRGASIATSALLGVTTVHGVVGNMLIFGIDADYKLKQVEFFAKDKSKVFLPSGAEMMSAGILGHMIKLYSGFDYQFTQVSEDASSFSVAYFNFDKEKGEKTKKMLMNAVQTPAKKFTVDQLDVTSTKASHCYIYPAKPGYNMVVDIQSKEKKMEMKLVKLAN